MRDVWEQMGPLLMLKRRGIGGRRDREDGWRCENRRCDERFSRDSEKKMEGKDETIKNKKINTVVCVWLTLKK